MGRHDSGEQTYHDPNPESGRHRRIQNSARPARAGTSSSNNSGRA